MLNTLTQRLKGTIKWEDGLLTTNPYNKIILHTAAAPFDCSAAEINQWHIEKGWRGIGYHFVIRFNGLIEGGRALKFNGAHTIGQNHTGIGICLSGDQSIFDLTDSQKSSLKVLVDFLKITYKLGIGCVHGHYEYAPKACPGYFGIRAIPALNIKVPIAHDLNHGPTFYNLGLNFGPEKLANMAAHDLY